MTYGTKQYKNGKIVGYLTFNSGKKVYMNEYERREFEKKIDYWECVAIDKFKNNLIINNLK